MLSSECCPPLQPTRFSENLRHLCCGDRRIHFGSIHPAIGQQGGECRKVPRQHAQRIGPRLHGGGVQGIAEDGPHTLCRLVLQQGGVGILDLPKNILGLSYKILNLPKNILSLSYNILNLPKNILSLSYNILDLFSPMRSLIRGTGSPTSSQPRGRVSGQHLGQVAGELGTEFLHAGSLLFV